MSRERTIIPIDDLIKRLTSERRAFRVIRINATFLTIEYVNAEEITDHGRRQGDIPAKPE